MIEPEYQYVLARYVSELPTGQPAPMMFCVGFFPLVKRLAFVLVRGHIAALKCWD